MAGRPNLNLQPSGPEALPVKISGSSASESEKPESGPEGATKAENCDGRFERLLQTHRVYTITWLQPGELCIASPMAID